MKTGILIIFLFTTKLSFSQIIFNNVENAAIRNTVLELNKYLLGRTVPDYKHTSENPYWIEGTEKYCDSVIDLFYDKKKYDSVAKNIEDSGGDRRGATLSLQYISISTFGNLVRCIPQDSIYVMGENEYKRINDIIDSSGYFGLTQIVIVGFKTKSNWNDFYSIVFDDSGKKIVLIMPIIQFHGRTNNEAQEFLKRYCNKFLKTSD